MHGFTLEELTSVVALAVTHAVDRVNMHRERPAGRLRVNSSVGAAKRLFRGLIIPFGRAYPEITLDIAIEDRMIAIVAAGFVDGTGCPRGAACGHAAVLHSAVIGPVPVLPEQAASEHSAARHGRFHRRTS